MTDLELMQMALRALKNAYSFIPMKMMEKHLQAETALRDRMAQPEPESVLWERREDGKIGPTNALPKREWVGLDEDDLKTVTDEFYAGASWAEAKLKEKNN